MEVSLLYESVFIATHKSINTCLQVYKDMPTSSRSSSSSRRVRTFSDTAEDPGLGAFPAQTAYDHVLTFHHSDEHIAFLLLIIS